MYVKTDCRVCEEKTVCEEIDSCMCHVCEDRLSRNTVMYVKTDCHVCEDRLS